MRDDTCRLGIDGRAGSAGSGRIAARQYPDRGGDAGNARGISARILAYGATLQSPSAPDRSAPEPQKFPEPLDQPGFVPARVDPGQPCHHAMIHRRSTTR